MLRVNRGLLSRLIARIRKSERDVGIINSLHKYDAQIVGLSSVICYISYISKLGKNIFTLHCFNFCYHS